MDKKYDSMIFRPVKRALKRIAARAITGSLVLSMLLSGTGCAPLKKEHNKGVSIEVIRSKFYSEDSMYAVARQDWMRTWVENGKGLYHFESEVLPRIVMLYTVVGRTAGYYIVFTGVRNAKDKKVDIDDFLLCTPDIISINGAYIDVKAVKQRMGELYTTNIPDQVKGKQEVKRQGPTTMLATIISESKGIAIPLDGGYRKWYNDCYDAVVRLEILEDLGVHVRSVDEILDALYVLTFEFIYAKAESKNVNMDSLIDLYKEKLITFRALLRDGNEKAEKLYSYLTPERILALNVRNLGQLLDGLKKTYEHWWYPSGNAIQIKIENLGFVSVGVVTVETFNQSQIRHGDVVMVDDSPFSSNSHWGILVNLNGWRVLNANSRGYILTPLSKFLKDSSYLHLYRKSG